MAATSRSCLLHHAWRYVALTLFVICLITSLVPLAFDSYAAQGAANNVSILLSGWFFLGLFWNSFVVGWESDRKELMHPGAVVALDLLTWIYGVFGVFWASATIADLSSAWRRRNSYDDYYYDEYYYDELSEHDYTSSLACFGIFVACAVAATIIHFILFVAGCINEERRRKAELSAPVLDNSHGPAGIATGTPSGSPDYLDSMNAAAAAKQAEIELQEREFGNRGDV